MKEKYVHIDVLFGQVQPEQVLAGILQTSKATSSQEFYFTKIRYAKDANYAVDSRFVAENCYLHAARGLKQNIHRTEDELLQRYRELKFDFLDKNPTGGLFALLDEYAEDILRFQNSEPLCRQEKILDWRERSLSLGQDLFTCAGLAARDVRSKCISHYFSWPAAIRTDNIDLRRMLRQGISENHFHLNGSTRMFSLCWSYLMNHPAKALPYFQKKGFEENLYPTTSYGALDNKQPWHQWIYDAAWIRERLYRVVQTQKKDSSLLKEFRKFCQTPNNVKKLNEDIGVLLWDSVRTNPGEEHAMDYVMTETLLHDNDSMVRLLVAERCFLYQCFYLFFSDTENRWKEEQDLFYLYILIKTQFRRELIQSNEQKGFRNFARYEQRKGEVWGDESHYWNESYRLSAGTVLTSQEEKKPLMDSLEMRITPKDKPAVLYKTVRSIDLAIQQVLYENDPKFRGKPPTEKEMLADIQENANFFYTIHFVKKPMEPLERTQKRTNAICRPRNDETRRDAEKYAKSMAMALRGSSYLCSRIRGIDGCNHEIGCRPETFATAFRFLRRLGPVQVSRNASRYWPLLGITYHVGEDFLDLTDGLRAIDEAVCFLNMERGDRLGHALALGTDPAQYYRVKNRSIYLPAQDLLDNLVWVLYRSLEWNISISSDLRASMEERAKQLLHQIYIGMEEVHGVSLNEYYSSWLLRGDAPEMYLQKDDVSKELTNRMEKLAYDSSSLSETYENAKLDERLWDYGSRMNLMSDAKVSSDMATQLRMNKTVRQLLFLYHFGREERIRGEQIERFEVGEEYIRLIRAFQNRMMRNIMQKGIAIECNPSSNKLIGSFDRYEKHPIFRFNHVGLPQSEYPDEHVELLVSVNTDDQGVFDTSLENEYALLYGCLQLRKDENGVPVVDTSSIREYLDQLRKMGNNCVFPKALCCAPRMSTRNSNFPR